MNVKKITAINKRLALIRITLRTFDELNEKKAYIPAYENIKYTKQYINEIEELMSDYLKNQ